MTGLESIMLIELAIVAFLVLSWAFVFFIIYFTPVIVAYVRRHENILAITILTIFLGWSFLGWLAALLWSLNSDIKENDD